MQESGDDGDGADGGGDSQDGDEDQEGGGSPQEENQDIEQDINREETNGDDVEARGQERPEVEVPEITLDDVIGVDADKAVDNGQESGGKNNTIYILK